MTSYQVTLSAETADALALTILKEVYLNYDEDYDASDVVGKNAVLKVMRLFMKRADYQDFCQQIVEDSL